MEAALERCAYCPYLRGTNEINRMLSCWLLDKEGMNGHGRPIGRQRL